MSKELEAPFGTPMEELRFLQKLEPVGTAFWHRFEYIAKALTPPTADELCVILSKEIGVKVIYVPSTKQFIYFLDEFEQFVTETYGDGKYTINNYLTPKSIKLIAMFYEVQDV